MKNNTKHTKRMITFAMACLLTVSVIGCGNNQGSNNTQDSVTSSASGQETSDTSAASPTSANTGETSENSSSRVNEAEKTEASGASGNAENVSKDIEKSKGDNDTTSQEAFKGVFNAMLKENSSYMKTKAMYEEMYPDAKINEKIADDKITISAEGGGEYLDGSWDYVLDGDYISFTRSGDNYTGDLIYNDVCYAVGDYLGQDHDLFSGYLMGLSNLDLENKYFIASADSDTSKIYIGGKWDMSELDNMYITEDSMSFFDPLENYQSYAQSVGKIRFIGNGDKSDFQLLLSEYGKLDDLALKSIENIVSSLKPDGYKDFLSSYTKIEDKKEDNYEAKILSAADKHIIEDMYEYNENYQYILIGFPKITKSAAG